jgi:hypothetical protein
MRLACTAGELPRETGVTGCIDAGKWVGVELGRTERESLFASKGVK